MAENKKSIIVYSDWIELFESLSDDEAGKLIKHFFRYINDKNPIAPDRITELSFIPIKQSLKRDLKKWEGIKVKRSEAGKKSAEVRKQNSTNSTSVEFVEQTSTNPTVSDSVNVSVSVSDILLEKETKDIKFDFRKSLIEFGIDKDLVSDWLLVRKNKKATNSKTSFQSIESQLLKCENELNIDRNSAIRQAVENSWSGFKSEWFKNEQSKNKQNGESKLNSDEFKQLALQIRQGK